MFKKYKETVSAILIILSISSCDMKPQPKEIYANQEFQVYPDKVIQHDFKAEALSATEIKSNYESPQNQFIKPVLILKFSVNGQDNEMPVGKNHQLNLVSKSNDDVSPIITFGQQYTDQTRLPANLYLKSNTKITLKVDMKAVLKAFKNEGFYTFYDGSKLYKSDFKGVFVAGNLAPLNWDFANLGNNKKLQLQDPDGDGIYTLDLILNKKEDQKSIASSWKLKNNISAFPQYHSDFVLSDALYNLALDEMQNAIEPDSTFRTGKEWAGVWTRDISYSIILSMAVLQPKVAMISLMRKVKNNRVIQDTGTGGSYPISTDRMIWAVAAWEVYKTTGDKNWLQQTYQIVKNSVADDEQLVYDEETGLARGESSFLDWREQTYPKWMQAADIYESECLGTNAVHFEVNKVLAQMAQEIGEAEEAKQHEQIAERIKKGINTYLWMPEKGYYGQFLYGRKYKILSPRSEALGEALTVLFGIAEGDRAEKVIENTPVNSFGIPCIYPQIPEILPYHNNAVWPFVQSYWALAAAKAGNASSVMQSIASVYRPAALFLTNKENFVASTGDYAGTQINSSNMLWSLSGSISLVYKVLFGIHYEANALKFEPFVPQKLAGDRSLKQLKYRNAVLDIEMKGFGKLKSIALDGKALAKPQIPASLSGKHQISIVLDNEEKDDKINLVEGYFSLPAPEVVLNQQSISWKKMDGAISYQIIKNGKLDATVNTTVFKLKDAGEYQVLALDKNQVSSFASQPIDFYPASAEQIIQLENSVSKSALPYQGFNGQGFIEISKEKNTSINLKVNITEAGLFALSFRYANGNGPINTENKCAIRSLYLDNHNVGAMVFPQRGKDEWSNWGFSNLQKISLTKGTHEFKLKFEAFDENMNGAVNQAMLDELKLVKLN
ncbi:MAG: glycogen debranching protein [Sphingobacteriales bacterium]|nr:glycogen debranching protein [Sphingobacteriales bacterium]